MGLPTVQLGATMAVVAAAAPGVYWLFRRTDGFGIAGRLYRPAPQAAEL